MRFLSAFGMTLQIREESNFNASLISENDLFYKCSDLYNVSAFICKDSTYFKG